MGLIYTTVTLRGDTGPAIRRRALVDTGATFLILPRAEAHQLGRPSSHKVLVRLADGTRRRVPVMTVFVRVNGREAPATTLVVPKGQVLLGAETLEALGMSVDMRRGRLKVIREAAITIALADHPRLLREAEAARAEYLRHGGIDHHTMKARLDLRTLVQRGRLE